MHAGKRRVGERGDIKILCFFYAILMHISQSFGKDFEVGAI
jgi:hypothetical protein